MDFKAPGGIQGHGGRRKGLRKPLGPFSALRNFLLRNWDPQKAILEFFWSVLLLFPIGTIKKLQGLAQIMAFLIIPRGCKPYAGLWKASSRLCDKELGWARGKIKGRARRSPGAPPPHPPCCVSCATSVCRHLIRVGLWLLVLELL